MGRPESPHGTVAAYKRHLRRHEEPCGPCRQANTDARRGDRRSPAVSAAVTRLPAPPIVGEAVDEGADEPVEVDDLALIVETLRKAMLKVASDDPAKVAPLARELRAAVEAVRGPAGQSKEPTLAEQLAEARAARAARAQSQGASA